MFELALVLLVASVFYPVWRLGSVRRSLSAEELLVIERSGDPPWRALLPVVGPGLVGYVLARMLPAHTVTIIMATLLVVVLASIAAQARTRRRMRAAGVPARFLSAWTDSGWVSLALFAAGVALLFAPHWPRAS